MCSVTPFFIRALHLFSGGDEGNFLQQRETVYLGSFFSFLLGCLTWGMVKGVKMERKILESFGQRKTSEFYIQMFFMYSLVKDLLSPENRSPGPACLVLTGKAHGVLLGFSQLADTHAGWDRGTPVLGQLEVSACSGPMGTSGLWQGHWWQSAGQVCQSLV